MARKASHSLMTDGRAAANLAKETWRDVSATFVDAVDRGHSAADSAYGSATKTGRKTAKRAEQVRQDASKRVKETRREASKRVNDASQRMTETRKEAARRASDTRDALTGRSQQRRKWGFFAAAASAILGAVAGVAGARLVKRMAQQQSPTITPAVRETATRETSPIRPVPATPVGTMPTTPEPIAKVTPPTPIRAGSTVTNGTNPSKPTAL